MGAFVLDTDTVSLYQRGHARVVAAISGHSMHGPAGRLLRDTGRADQWLVGAGANRSNAPGPGTRGHVLDRIGRVVEQIRIGPTDGFRRDPIPATRGRETKCETEPSSHSRARARIVREQRN